MRRNNGCLIEFHPNRVQPYTLWCTGFIRLFSDELPSLEEWHRDEHPSALPLRIREMPVKAEA